MTPTYTYGVYGVALTSDFALDLPPLMAPPKARFELTRAHPGSLDAGGAEMISPDDWFAYAILEDGRTFARWRGLGEFMVSADGLTIQCAKAPEATEDSFQVYLLGQALSFALVNAGFEPIHGTAIVHGGEAIALLGDSGYGKSTLAASFLAAGAALLTDDLLLIGREGGRLVAYPGPSRLKLLSDSSQRFLPETAEGVLMNVLAGKRVFPLEGAQIHPRPAPIRAICVLQSPADPWPADATLTPLTPREAFVALVANTFNRYSTGRPRLERQLVQTAQLSRAIPVSRLSFPRGVERLADVRAAILAASGLGDTAAA